MAFIDLVGLNSPERREQAARVLAEIKTRGIRSVRIAYPDLLGVLRGKMVRAGLLPAILDDGCAFGALLLLADLTQHVHPSVRLGDEYDYGNCILLPDPATFAPLPWSPDTALVLADPYLPDGRPAVSARLALRRAVAQARQASLDLQVGLEIECTVYPLAGRPGFSDRADAFTATGLGRAALLLGPLWTALDGLGVGLDGYVNELSAGQVEFHLAPRPALAAADGQVLLKLATRELLAAAGYGITWMARPDNHPETMTNGLHVHQAGLDETGRNLFADPRAKYGLAPLLRHYIGGQLAHAALCAVFSTPSVTGYKRYQPGTWAPTSATWSLDNRTSMLRVMPERGPATRLENRLPEAAANPYLALAALLVAGLDGIDRQLDPGPPVSGNAATAHVAIPTTIWAAIPCLESSSPIADFFGPDLITAYRGILLRSAERMAAYVTDWEVAEYKGIL